MKITAACTIQLQLEIETPLLLMLRPLTIPSQRIICESNQFSQEVDVIEYTDHFGNLCQRLVAPAGDFEIHSEVEAQTSGAADKSPAAPFVLVQDLPQVALVYLLPSRYCESDRMGDLTRGMVGELIPGYDQVAAISDWLRHNIEYRPGSSDLPLSADEVRRQGFGVCRDMAHLGIAMCRSISIPARMVVGYLAELEPMDLHAWFEAYVGGRWYVFDPTQQELDNPRLAIAHGRDAADVAIYHTFGPLPLTSAAIVSVEKC